MKTIRCSLLALACLMAACGSDINNPDVDASIDSAVVIDANSPDAAMACGCPALNPGDMFVVCRTAPQQMKYIINSDGEAMYFPNDAFYQTWRENENDLLSITQDCFDATPVPNMYPGAVNLHPGSFVVRRVNDPQLYVLLPHNTVARITPEMAAALYMPAYLGGEGNEPVVIADQFWPNRINRAPDITQLHVHPGLVFKVVGNDTTYYAHSDGTSRVVTDIGFQANHLQERFVREVPASATQGMVSGHSISSRILELDDPTQGG